jgi:FAD/FMN-containing dehydrogenase
VAAVTTGPVARCASGIVIDLTAMNDVTLSPDYRAARISGGARASDVLAVTDPRGLAVVTGSCSSVGMTGLTLGGGYGSLIARFGLALDNLLAAEVVLADGRIRHREPSPTNRTCSGHCAAVEAILAW